MNDAKERIEKFGKKYDWKIYIFGRRERKIEE